jgi:hypothetical protein
LLSRIQLWRCWKSIAVIVISCSVVLSTQGSVANAAGTPTRVLKTSIQDDLDQQSYSSNAQTRVNVSNNANTAPSTLARLSYDGNDYVRVGVAQNPNTDTATLQRLASDGNAYVSLFATQQLANRNPTPSATPSPTPSSTPSPTQSSTPSATPSPTRSSTPSATPTPTRSSTPSATPTPVPATSTQIQLDRQSYSSNAQTRVNVSNNANTAPSTLARLSYDGNDYVRVGVAQNPNTDTATLRRLANDGNAYVSQFAREQLANRGSTPSATPSPTRSSTPSPTQSSTPSATPSPTRSSTPSATPSQIDLNEPSFLSGAQTRVNVSNNANTAPSTLARLSYDGNDYVRVGVAQNPNTDTATLQRLASDGNTYVSQFAREQLANRGSTPSATPIQDDLDRQRALLDAHSRVNLSPDFLAIPIIVAKPALLEELSRRRDPVKRVGVAKSSYATIAQLQRLAKDSNDYVRLAVARNKITDTATLQRLANDGNAYVSLLAKNQLTNRSSTLPSTLSPARRPTSSQIASLSSGLDSAVSYWAAMSAASGDRSCWMQMAKLSYTRFSGLQEDYLNGYVTEAAAVRALENGWTLIEWCRQNNPS